ncbi:hypothetical protein G9A89_009240 [Geosiphon pyriformis]|nr:hypothetical protein G9A89_009240 [Geosiphon pyriformis]
MINPNYFSITRPLLALRKDGILEESADVKGVFARTASDHLWGSETGNTTKSESVDMKEECLIEETSFDLGDSGSLGEDDDFLDGSTFLPPFFSLKPFVLVFVHKFFALDIDFVVITEKSSQEKLSFVRKIFSDVNSFGEASTPLKFGGIIQTTFTSEEAMMAATKLANNCMPGNNHTNWAIVLKEISVGTSVEAVQAAVSEFGIIKKIKMQLVGLWQKMLFMWPGLMWINKHKIPEINLGLCSILSLWKQLLIICEILLALLFNLVSTMATTPVIKKTGLCWSHLLLALCLIRLAKINTKKSAPISCLLAFSSKTWVSVVGAFSVHVFYGTGLFLGSNNIGKPLSPVVNNLKSHLVSIESSFVSLIKQISELAKRLKSLVPALLVTLLLQDQEKDIVMGVGLGETTSDKITMIVNSLASPHVIKLENMLEGLSNGLVWRVATYNIKEMNNPTKQDDIIYWHKDINNLVSIFTESKLKEKIQPWIVNKFEGVWVFTSGLESGYLSASVIIVINLSLAKHVCKISEMSGQLLSIKLLFKNKFSVSILGLYASASLVVQFSQADKINSMIAKTVNEFFFVILGRDFNKNSTHKCASFKKCFDLGLVNSLYENSVMKNLMWCNSCGVAKTIDYVFISLNLTNTIVDHNVVNVMNYFDTDHKSVSVSVSVKDLLDIQLNLLRKQANRDHWKFDVKNVDDTK